MPTSAIEIGTAGPACSAAAWPVSTKMPAPMMAPMPSVIRFRGPSARLSWCSPAESASARNVEMDLVAHKFMRDSIQRGDESTVQTDPRFARASDLSIEESVNDQYERRTRTDHCWSAGIIGSVNASGSPNCVSAAYGSGEMPEYPVQVWRFRPASVSDADFTCSALATAGGASTVIHSSRNARKSPFSKKRGVGLPDTTSACAARGVAGSNAHGQRPAKHEYQWLRLKTTCPAW